MSHSHLAHFFTPFLYCPYDGCFSGFSNHSNNSVRLSSTTQMACKGHLFSVYQTFGSLSTNHLQLIMRPAKPRIAIQNPIQSPL